MEHPPAVPQLFLTRLAKDDDLLQALTAFLDEHRIRQGSLSIIGALTHWAVGYWDGPAARYLVREGEGQAEILHCAGNISIRDGAVFPHLHITLAGPDYLAFGGHVCPGCRVFAAEVTVLAVQGPDLVREFDPATGLMLWPSTRSGT